MYNPQLETCISVADAGSLTYAIIKSYEYAKLMISPLEETEMLWSSVFVTLVAKKYRFMQFELDMVFDTH